jgi:phosphoserine aminotransferase
VNKTRPDIRPNNPRFSSGPCTKPPEWQLGDLKDAYLGRSHRSAEGKARLKLAIDTTHEILELPTDYRVGIVPASDTGAVEIALWSLLGQRPVEMLAWESFGAGWVTDVTKQLKLDHVTLHQADYGQLPDLSKVNFDNDVVFTWNGTTSGVRVPDGDFIPTDRKGLTICDATSAAFAQTLDWNKLDVVTFSWQKVLGGEGAHGMLILSPRAVERLESYTPPWPLPKLFRLTKNGKLTEGIFRGETMNTPSMLCVEDYLNSLSWAKSVGGQKGLIARADANLAAVMDFVNDSSWLASLTEDPACQSNTSICLKIVDSRVLALTVEEQAAFARGLAKRLDVEGVAFDIGSYRDAPPGLRIWAGSTVETSDMAALMPWLDWAFEQQLLSLS